MTKFPRQKKKSSSKSFKAPIPRPGLEIDVSDTSSSRQTESDVTSLLSPRSLPDIGDDNDDTTTIGDESVVTLKSPSPTDEPDGKDYYDTPIQNFEEKLVPKTSRLSASNPALNNVNMTLPRQFPLTRTKSITRSLVPAMRRMFEKSRSCDPEPKPRPAILPPTSPTDQHLTTDGGSMYRTVGGNPATAISASNILNAGTESARSSFMLYEPVAAGTLLHHHSGDHLEDVYGEQANGGDDQTNHQNNKGFVKKCVSKVKSYIG